MKSQASRINQRSARRRRSSGEKRRARKQKRRLVGSRARRPSRRVTASIQFGRPGSDRRQPQASIQQRPPSIDDALDSPNTRSRLPPLRRQFCSVGARGRGGWQLDLAASSAEASVGAHRFNQPHAPSMPPSYERRLAVCMQSVSGDSWRESQAGLARPCFRFNNAFGRWRG